MIPEGRFSLTPITGVLTSPLSLDRLTGYCMGPVAVQDPSQGFLVKVWTVWVDGFSVYISASGVTPVLMFTRASKIHNVSLAFDTNANPCIAFQESGLSYLYWYDPVPNTYVFFHIPSAASPYITRDDPRIFNQANADVILGYVSGSALKFRQLRDRYTIEYIPTVGVGGPSVAADILYYIGINSALRLEWIYGFLPTFHDTPDIMKKQVLQQKAAPEVLDVTFDFMHTMMFGDYITAAAAVVTLESGTDASPSNMLDGTPTFTTRTVTQTIKGGVVGNVYRIAMSARTFNECVYVVEGLLAINDSPAVTPP